MRFQRFALLALLATPLAAQDAQQYHNITLFQSDFEDGQLGGWHGRGTDAKVEKVAVISGLGHGGTHALKVTNRTTTWQGPMHTLADGVVPGDIYRVGAWIYYDEGPANAVFMLSVERSFKDAKAAHKYNNIAQISVAKGQWTFITTDYTVSADPTQKTLELYIERPYKDDNLATPDDTISFSIDDVSAVKLDPAMKPKVQEDIPNLVDVWRDTFTVGAAVTPDDVDTTGVHSQLLMKHFGAVVPGNALKWESTEPTEGQFSFADGDKIVEFAGLTGMVARGHTLVWHNQTPAWVFQDPSDPTKPASKELLLKRLKNHIDAVVGHYKGQITSWDVVNEALSDSTGTLRSGAERSKWFEILGPDYIAQAFRWAHAADPDAQLVYNDYNLESNPAKRDAAVLLIKTLKAQGVPIDAVGLQMHISITYPELKQIRDTIAQFAALGVKVLITELDVSIYASASEAKKAPTPALLLAQAQRYKDLFAIFKTAAAKKQIELVMIWGMADDGTWLDDFPVPGRGDAPLLFDRRLQAKPAFWAVVDPTKVKGLK
jgi:endo-1,4-beta-xylanase